MAHDPKKIQAETWTSDDNRKEVHLFRKGIFDSYVMGWNPAIFKKEEIVKFLEEHDIDVGKEKIG